MADNETILTEEISNQRTIVEREQHVEEPLLQVQGNQQPAAEQQPRSKKKIIIIGSLVFLATLAIMLIVITRHNGANPQGLPIAVRIAFPNNKPTIIEMGNSRVAEVLFYSGNDDRTSDNYKAVTQRNIVWSVSSDGIISIDPYGRIETISPGTVDLKVQSADNQSAWDSKTIQVVEKQIKTQLNLKKRIINYQGTPVKPFNLPQKLVTRVNMEEALLSNQVPESIKQLLKAQTEVQQKKVVLQDDVIWQIKYYADNSNRSYVLRTNKTATEGDRNKYQYFMGNRYLPGDGLSATLIQDDGNQGIWVTNKNKQISHIVFTTLNTTSKAVKMVRDYKPYLRYGLASGTDRNGDSWTAGISDNDGLWTSMFGVGELMRYSWMKYMSYDAASLAEARESALTSLKAVLMISNVPSRDTVINARIRHFNNTRDGDGTRMSREFLKKGATYSVDNYVGNSMDGLGFFGVSAGKTINGLSYGGKQVYTYAPTSPDDWSTNATLDEPATTKRTLKGFIARSFGITNLDTVPSGGLFFKHNSNGTQKVLQDAYRLYDYSKGETPILNLGNLPLPEVLMDIINLKGTQYNKSDLFYKGDTSTDEVIGHIFIYKVAFDVLDENDPIEKELKDLIVKTMINFCTGLIGNGYSFVDATGQGTTWGKMVRDFMNSDFTIQDAPVKTIQVLMSFKVCAYVTGDPKWQEQYRFLIEDPSFRYLDVVAGVWKRWVWRSFNEDYWNQPFQGKLNTSEKYSSQEIIRHVMMEIHYSDEEEALLAYYLAFQLEENEQYLAKYREGLEGWWQSISRSENPIWYFIYQLAYPNSKQSDHFGNDLLDVAMWQLQRHPVSTIKYTAYVQGSRQDVLCQGQGPVLSVDPTKIIQKRKQISDAKYAERPINKQTVPNYDSLNLYDIKVLPKDERSMQKFNSATFQAPYRGSSNSMQPPTTYTLPYWMGVYHKMIDPQ